MIFLLLLPFFILIFVVLLPAVWSLAIYGALRLRGCEAFGLLIAVVVGASALYAVGDFTPEIIYAFYLGGFIIGTPIYLLIFRSRLRYINETKAKKLLIFGSIATLFIIWELEVPQQVIFNNLTKHSTARYMYDIEIVDELFDGNTTEVRYGFSEEYRQCFKGLASCPILPSFKQLQNQFFTIRDGKKIIVANVYGPYYGSTDLMLYLDTFKDGGGITYEKSFYIDDKKVFQYLRNLKSDNQKSSQKGENNGNK